MGETKGTPAAYLSDVVKVEGAIEHDINQALHHADAYGTVLGDALQQLLTVAQRHRQALQTRLPGFSGPEVESQYGKAAYSSLSSLYASLSQAAFAYTFLHTVAHRFYDGTAEGSTGGLAEQHLRDYVQAISTVDQLLSDFVVRGQGDRAEECQCRCPACSVGICLCSTHGTATVNKAWRDTSRPDGLADLRVRPPRKGSSAERAGLGTDDTIIGVDGQAIATIVDLQAAIQKHQAGESIRLAVRRKSGEERDAVLVR